MEGGFGTTCDHHELGIILNLFEYFIMFSSNLVI